MGMAIAHSLKPVTPAKAEIQEG